MSSLEVDGKASLIAYFNSPVVVINVPYLLSIIFFASVVEYFSSPNILNIDVNSYSVELLIMSYADGFSLISVLNLISKFYSSGPI